MTEKPEEEVVEEVVKEEAPVDVNKTIEEGHKNFKEGNAPANKEEWNKLQQEDPKLLADLSQQNVDKIYREKKELEERAAALEAQKNNLSVELEKYKNKAPKEEPVEEVADLPYSINNLPETKEQWEDLFIENPVLATDLRTQYNNLQIQQASSFEEAQAKARRTVQAEHPDMYLAELDESGKPRKDEKGNLVLKKDLSGEPIYNPHSEKGKLWLQIYNENPNIAELPNAPELMMAAMERRLRSKGEEIVQTANEAREQQIREGQVVPEGVAPPAKVDVTFKDEDERAHAQKQVNRGVYANLEEYVTIRDSKEAETINEVGSMPNFK